MRKIYQKQLMIMAISAFMMLLLLFSGSSLHAQIATATSASRCGEGTLTLHATATSGTITWYDVPFYGTPLGTGTTFTTPSLSVTKTYYVDAVDVSGCSLNKSGNTNTGRVTVIATVSANSMQASIYYSSSTFCKSVTDWQLITLTGNSGGTFSVDPAIDATGFNTLTGDIKPSAITEGLYTITYIAPYVEGCVESPATTTVTITTAPATPFISYNGSPYCTSAGVISVNQTGETGGTYTASPSGLAINATNGTITPASSLSGNYTITYFVPGAGGCSPQTATTTIAILQLPTANISYATPFTKNQGSQPVTLTGTGIYTGGTYSSAPAGLTIDPSTGAITPSSSTAGTYTVTYTLPAVTPCTAPTPAIASVTIYDLPTASIAGTTTICNGGSANLSIALTGSTPWSFTYTDGLTPITVSNQTTTPYIISVSPITTKIYTLTAVSDAHCAGTTSGSAEITVSSVPVALFTYNDSPYCSNGTNPFPTFLEGGVAGTFSSTSGLVFANSSTGEINLAASTPGTYTIANTIAPANGCGQVVATASITITKLPVALFSYSGTPYCNNVANPLPTMGEGAIRGLFTSTAGLVFTDATTGEINLAASTPGTYTVANTIVAANGCGEVSYQSQIIINTAVIVGTPTFAIGEISSRCQAGETVAYTATATNNTSMIYSIDIASLDAGNSINATSGELAYTQSWSGTTTITAIATANCGNITTANHIATTLPTAIVENPIFSLGETSTRCQKAENMTYTATATNSTNISYTLDAQSMNGGNTINPSSGEVNWATNWSGTSTITATATAGCSNTTTAEHTITTNPLPIASAGGHQTICLNGTSTVSGASASNGTILWTHNGNGTISDATTLTPTYTPTTLDAGSTVTLTMTVTTEYETCTGATATATATFTVNVNPLPTATIAGDITVCQGANAPEVTFTGANATAPYTFTYKINEGESQTVTTTSGNSVTVSQATTTAGTYTYTLISVQDASITTCSQSQTGTTTITVVADPTLSQPGNISICKGGTTTLSTSASGGTGTYSYQWQYSANGTTGWADVATGTPTGITYSGNATTSLIITGDGNETAQANYYKCVLTTNTPIGAGCDAETTPITVTSVLDPSWATITTPATSITYGGSVTFSATVENGLGGTISWIRSTTPGGAGVTVTSPDYPTAVGTYYYRPHYEPTGSGCDLIDRMGTTVVVEQKALANSMIAAIGNQTYTGLVIEPTPVVTDGSPSIIVAGDYTVSYSNNTNAGTATVTITATNANYSGTASKTFTIDKAPLTPSVASVTGKTYDGNTSATGTISLATPVNSQTPTATGTFVWTSANAGTTIVDVTGIALVSPWGDNYQLSATTLSGITAPDGASIGKKALDNDMITAIGNQTYTGLVIEPTPVVTDGSPSIIVAGDYTVSYSNNTNAGTATVTITATNANYSGTASKTFTITPKTIATATVAGVTAPATGGTPTATISATTEYTATISWSPADNPFQDGEIYTATITITPTTNYTLAGVGANFFTIAGAIATNNAGSGVVTAIFPATN